MYVKNAHGGNSAELLVIRELSRQDILSLTA